MISVAMCTYNGEKYVGEQIESILHQSMSPDEIVICDDCSSDNTLDIVKATLTNWKGICKVVRNENNLGFSKNFEKAISLCSGDVIFLSDQDDVWDSQKIQVIMRVFHSHEKIAMVFHNAEIVDESLNSLGLTFWGDKYNIKKIMRADYSALLVCNNVQGASVAFRKTLFDKSKPFPKGIAHDDWLALNAYILKAIYPINKCLIKYRQTGENVLGAELSGVKKIKKWVENFTSSTKQHQSYLEYQILRWESLIERYSSRVTIEKINCLKLLNFQKTRLTAIRNKRISDLPKVKAYFYFFRSSDQAFKQYCKDILVILSLIF